MNFEIDIWQELELSPTQDKKVIKKAYAKKLKLTSPEKNPEGFKKLRWAYEQVLSQLNNPKIIEAEIYPIESPLQNSTQNLEQKNITGKEQINPIEEIIRCLTYSFEPQAIAYLEEMISNDELTSITIRQTLERMVFSYLYQVGSNEKWPADFVTVLVNSLGMVDLAEQDRELSQHLDYFYFRMVCKQNNWTEAEYRAHQELLGKVNETLIAIRVSLFDDGEEIAIKVLDDFFGQGLFSDEQFVVEFRYRFLNELNQYFPASYPVELAERIEGFLDVSSFETDECFTTAISNLKERKAASLEVKKFKDFAHKHPNSAKGICYRVFLDQCTLSNTITAKTRFIYKELLCFIENLSSFSEKARNFELINDEALNEVKEWTEKIKNIDGDNFKKDQKSLQSLVTILKQWGVVLAVLSLVIVSYVGLEYLQIIPDFKSKEKLTGIGYLNLLGLGCWALAGCYHLYEKFIGHNIYGFRYQVLLKPPLRRKVIITLFFSSILVAALLSHWQLISVYVVLLLIISCFFLSGLMSLILLALPIIPALGAAKLIGVYVDGEPNLLLHTLMIWVLYGSYLWLNHWKYKFMPGTSPHMLPTWTVLTALYSFMILFACSVVL